MNNEQKKFKRVMKKRVRSERKKKLLKVDSTRHASRMHVDIVAYRKERKEVSKHNTGVTLARRKQLLKMLTIPDAEANKYSNGYLEGMYEVAIRRSHKK